METSNYSAIDTEGSEVNKMRTHFTYSESFPNSGVDAESTMRAIHRIVEARMAEQIAGQLEHEQRAHANRALEPR